MLDSVTNADEQGHAREAALAVAEGVGDQETTPGSSVDAYFMSNNLAHISCRSANTHSHWVLQLLSLPASACEVFES